MRSVKLFTLVILLQLSNVAFSQKMDDPKAGRLTLKQMLNVECKDSACFNKFLLSKGFSFSKMISLDETTDQYEYTGVSGSCNIPQRVSYTLYKPANIYALILKTECQSETDDLLSQVQQAGFEKKESHGGLMVSWFSPYYPKRVVNYGLNREGVTPGYYFSVSVNREFEYGRQ